MIKLKKLIMENLLESEKKLSELPNLLDKKNDDKNDNKENEKILEPIDSQKKSVTPILYNEIPEDNTAFKSLLTLLISHGKDSNTLDGIASSLVRSVFNFKNKQSFDSFLKKTQESFGDIPGYIDLIDKMKVHVPDTDNNYTDTSVNISEVLKILKKIYLEEKNNPCWKGYKQIGMKIKNKKKVPNCVPKLKEIIKKFLNEIIEESKCTKVTKKTSSSRKDKKWMKCVKQPDGSIKRIHWGDPNAKVTGKSGNTKRKKNFKARHDCKNAKPGTAKYQACKDWE